jgi:hypothetical protein
MCLRMMKVVHRCRRPRPTNTQNLKVIIWGIVSKAQCGECGRVPVARCAYLRSGVCTRSLTVFEWLWCVTLLTSSAARSQIRVTLRTRFEIIIRGTIYRELEVSEGASADDTSLRALGVLRVRPCRGFSVWLPCPPSSGNNPARRMALASGITMQPSSPDSLTKATTEASRSIELGAAGGVAGGVAAVKKSSSSSESSSLGWLVGSSSFVEFANSR